MNSEILAQLLTNLLGMLKAKDNDNRFILGIVGTPASGKSTLSKWLCNAVNQGGQEAAAVIVPMDGFHRYNDELERLKQRHLKGTPETFDGEKFIRCLKRIHNEANENINLPEYDRTRSNDPIENAIVVRPEHKLIIIEGNYLLMETSPWHEVKKLLSESWYLSRSIEARHPALIQRHINGGMTREQAEAKVASTDLPNSILVEQTKHRADRVLVL